MSLIDAVSSGDLEALRDQLARSNEVDIRDGIEWTPLKAAGHHECSRALIDAGAALDNVSIRGWTALMWSVVGPGSRAIKNVRKSDRCGRSGGRGGQQREGGAQVRLPLGQSSAGYEV